MTDKPILVPDDLHKKAKRQALEKDMSIKDYVSNLVRKDLEREASNSNEEVSE